jgi:hypothetical protein
MGLHHNTFRFPLCWPICYKTHAFQSRGMPLSGSVRCCELNRHPSVLSRLDHKRNIWLQFVVSFRGFMWVVNMYFHKTTNPYARKNMWATFANMFGWFSDEYGGFFVEQMFTFCNKRMNLWVKICWGDYQLCSGWLFVGRLEGMNEVLPRFLQTSTIGRLISSSLDHLRITPNLPINPTNHPSLPLNKFPSYFLSLFIFK